MDADPQPQSYGDFGMPKDLPGADRAVFGQLESAAGSTRRENGMTITDQPFFVSVRGASLDEVRGYWDQLSIGASIVEPLAASAWSPGFGMLTDGFGVKWILDVAAEYDAG
ncbi:hypothetical protein [Microbacterium sp.]|uniref:hypothetical protein n=1 Tax=Microbacterium sp. TaxID=51671 RepID=UPI003C788B4D